MPVQFNVVLPIGLRKLLKLQAKKERRTMQSLVQSLIRDELLGRRRGPARRVVTR